MKRSAIALLCLVTIPVARAADPEDCGPEPPLPISRGQDEIRKAVTDVFLYLRENPTTPDRLKALVQPYAPLDLEFRGKHTAEEASNVKNFFFGVVSSSAGLDDQAILGISLGVLARGEAALRSPWTERLGAQRLLVDRFRKLDATVIAKWSADEYRINDWFKLRENAQVFQRSSELGLWPWGAVRSPAEETPSKPPLPEGQHDSALQLLSEMTSLGVLAIVRQPSGTIRVIHEGAADNEAGILFVAPGTQQPRQGDELSDGKCSASTTSSGWRQLLWPLRAPSGLGR